MAKKLRKGDEVSWKTHGTTTKGKVVRKITENTVAAKREVKASKERPQYLVKSSKTGRKAVHKPSALTRI